jgi:hypothetical protein
VSSRVALPGGLAKPALAALVLVGCDYAYPEVVVVNELGEAVLVRGASFNGCRWDETLAHEQASAPGRCLPGADRVHFERFDAVAYCQNQVTEGDLPGLCLCDQQDMPAQDPHDLGIISQSPLWFNYQTVTTKQVHYGSFYRFVLTDDDLEQDFSVPGPYGH